MFIALSGCATGNFSKYEKYNASEVDWAAVDDKETEFYRKIRSHEDSKPKIGLALSGGGQRAATVSIGFLKALQEKQILKHVDVVSSVSGGSYAAYWWYTKNYWALEKKEQQLVLEQQEGGQPPLIFSAYIAPSLCNKLHSADNEIPGCNEPTKEEKLRRYIENRFHFHNYNHGYLLNYAQENTAARNLELLGKSTSWLVTTPIHWIANGLFDMKLNLNLFQDYYQNGIERDYGLYPLCDADNCKPLESYINSKNRFKLDKSKPSPAELFESIEDRKLPYWVINTTAAYSKSSWPKMLRGQVASGYSKMLANTVYEFTPTHQGSPRFGYTRYEQMADDDLIDFSRMVALSGAAVDSLSPAANTAIDVANLSLGQYIRNPNIDSQTKFIHRLLPIPFYWLHHNKHDETSPFIYLSDGGHSGDNLGIYSLLRRGVQQVIVLDAEAETTKSHIAKFESLRHTRCLLMLERGLLIDVKGATQEEAACEFGDKHAGFHVREAPTSILHGEVCKAKESDTNCVGKEVVAKIIYAKLSVSRDIFDSQDTKSLPIECMSDQKYSCNTKWFAIHNNKEGRFPHDPTFDIFYSPDQYSGYMALGYDIGKSIEWDNLFLYKNHPAR